jgi:hypothetical protein
MWHVDMQGMLKGIRVCHGDMIYIEHDGRVAGGLVGSLSGNCEYGVRLRITGVWTDTNAAAQRTSGGYFYLEFPRERESARGFESQEKRKYNKADFRAVTYIVLW